MPHELLGRRVEDVDDERSFDEVILFILLEPPGRRMRMGDFSFPSAGGDANQKVRSAIGGLHVALALEELGDLLPNAAADLRRARAGGRRNALGGVEGERSVVSEACRG